LSRSLEEEIRVVLRRHMSPINAGSVLHRAKTRALPDGTPVSLANAATLFDALRAGVAMFCGETKWDAVKTDLLALLTKDDTAPFARRVDVRVQDDIGLARDLAMDACATAGADRYLTQKIVTAVSELARNIADYSHGGFVEISLDGGRLLILAEDTGPGIEQLDRILAGTYRSRTGLGRGLRGVRQMMDKTEIRTGPTGTRITAEASVWT
jgi:serine/threonine-protein kinase RsbT